MRSENAPDSTACKGLTFLSDDRSQFGAKGCAQFERLSTRRHLSRNWRHLSVAGRSSFCRTRRFAALVRCLRQIARSETAGNRRNNGIMKRSKAADDGDAAGPAAAGCLAKQPYIYVCCLSGKSSVERLRLTTISVVTLDDAILTWRRQQEILIPVKIVMHVYL